MQIFTEFGEAVWDHGVNHTPQPPICDALGGLRTD